MCESSDYELGRYNKQTAADITYNVSYGLGDCNVEQAATKTDLHAVSAFIAKL